MKSKLNGVLLVDVCKDHKNKPNQVAHICGSVLKWKCRKCKKIQKTNPHYAENQEYVCEDCQSK